MLIQDQFYDLYLLQQCVRKIFPQIADQINLFLENLEEGENVMSRAKDMFCDLLDPQAFSYNYINVKKLYSQADLPQQRMCKEALVAHKDESHDYSHKV